MSEIGAKENIRPKREEVTGWRKLHNEEVHNFYYLPNIIRSVIPTG
jgi:hypothetical protein